MRMKLLVDRGGNNSMCSKNTPVLGESLKEQRQVFKRKRFDLDWPRMTSFENVDLLKNLAKPRMQVFFTMATSIAANTRKIQT